MKLFFYIIILGLTVSGCQSKKNDSDIILPSANLYNDGLNALEQQKYSKAAEQFGRIFYQNPGDPITPQAELMQSYSLFLDAQYEEAVDVLDMFIKLHPANEDIGYAYYLKALSYYMQISSVQLDQSRTLLAKMSFEEVISLFPNTKYALDAALKIDLVNDHLAGKEMSIGRYYLRKNNPIAATNRFKLVIDNYQTTSHTPEALYRLAESYLMLGLVEEAKKYAGVLKHNYPDSEWNRYSNSLNW
jgi:outer membrane protein assembly factor BamD